MKFLFDANMPPSWPRAISALVVGKDARVSEVTHLRDKFDPSTPDEQWLRTLADEGDWVVVSKDGFKKSDGEKHLVHRAGLAVFVLAPAWAKQKHWECTVQIIRWWPKLVDTAALARAALRVPWNVTSKMDSIR
ncbi:hypothetical protein [Aquabacterium sp.]|uniref:PIN-like domain-containing protein n=1 Tax=Aquabacterium sp. TaxID=1872578 RepID=UPI003782ED75